MHSENKQLKKIEKISSASFNNNFLPQRLKFWKCKSTANSVYYYYIFYMVVTFTPSPQFLINRIYFLNFYLSTFTRKFWKLKSERTLHIFTITYATEKYEKSFIYIVVSVMIFVFMWKGGETQLLMQHFKKTNLCFLVTK